MAPLLRAAALLAALAQVSAFGQVAKTNTLPVKNQFTLVKADYCEAPITTLSSCSAAAAELGLTDKSAEVNVNTAELKPYDPAGCYQEGGTLKFNDGAVAATANTGRCTPEDVCLCQAKYFLQTSGNCADPIQSLSECTSAAQALVAAQKGVDAQEDGQDAAAFDPPHCYFEGKVLNYNGKMTNTGKCTPDDICVCKTPEADAASTPCPVLRNQDVVAGTGKSAPITGVHSTSDLDCSAKCSDQEVCTAWVRQPTTGTCWMVQEASPVFEEDSDRNSGLRCSADLPVDFDFSFESSKDGTCPGGWTCTGPLSHVMDVSKSPITDGLNPKDFAHGASAKIMSIGGDTSVGTASSKPFTLPTGCKTIRWLQAGGADAPSGFYVKLQSGVDACFGTVADDVNSFKNATCDVSAVGNAIVYLFIQDVSKGSWGKVLIDDIQFLDARGHVMHNIGGPPALRKYTQYRFNVDPGNDDSGLRNYQTANSVQVAELRLYGPVGVLLSGDVATNPGGHNPAPEKPANVVDGQFVHGLTKWLDFNKGDVVVTFPHPVGPIAKYNWATANDAPERDPTKWELEGSNNGFVWHVLDSTHASKAFNTTKARGHWQGPFTLNGGTAPPTAAPVDIASQKCAIKVCTDASLGGACCSVGMGTTTDFYNTKACFDNKVGNDQLTSVEVKAGCTATACSSNCGSSKSWQLNGPATGTTTFTSPHDFRDNDVSSFVVESRCASTGLLLKSWKNKYLEDNNGVVGLSASTGANQIWHLEDAGEGKFYIESTNNKQLEDREDKVGVHPDHGAWQKWEFSSAGAGLLYVTGHRGERLEDRNDAVSLDPDKGAWQKWSITAADGTPACTTPKQVKLTHAAVCGWDEIKQPMTFAAAEAECVRRGGHLASLHSVADSNQVYKLAKQEDSWIGLSKVGRAWTWVDGTPYGQDTIGLPAKKELWNVKQGDDGACGRWGWKGKQVWDDVSCDEKKPATCRICGPAAN